MSFRPQPNAAALMTYGLIAGGIVLTATINLPGHLSYDSVVQLHEGRSGVYGNWHPPMMSWLLGVFDDIVRGTALFVVFDCALVFGSLAALVWLKPRASWAAPAALVLCLLTPQFVLYQGIVWKDVLFADLSIAGFVCLAIAGEVWPNRYWRLALVAKAMLLLTIASLVRQNGILVLPAGCAALAWIAWSMASHRRIREAAKYGFSTLAGASLAVVAIHSALALRVDGNASPTVQVPLLQLYDLIGAVHLQPSLALPTLDRDDSELEHEIRTDGVRLYTPERNDTLAQSEDLQDAFSDAPGGALSNAWWGMIVHHPGLYLRLRLEVFRWVFLTPDLPACRPVYTGVFGPADDMKQLGLKERLDARDRSLAAYASSFNGTPIVSHAAYAVLALGLMAALFLRHRPADIAIAFLLLAGMAFTASFFVISIACDYRYLYFLDLAALVAAFYMAMDWRGVRERKS